MNAPRVDAIIRFALAVAAEHDERFQRSLGPIHLLKYVYLADLGYAGRHGGETFTDAPWRFHTFGPWAPEVFERIEPAARELGATVRQISSSRYDRDFVRYQFEDDDDTSPESVAQSLPIEVQSTVRRFVREFGQDTDSLLAHVYRTRPMLAAAPGESLDFSTAAAPPVTQATAPEPEQLSRRAEKKRDAAIDELRGRIRKRVDERRRKRVHRVTPQPAPRYDSVFEEGQRFLDQLAGDPVPDAKIGAEFSPEIWHSRGRSDVDVT
jgi:hypothetical protein